MDSLYVIRERMQDLYSRYSIVADKAIQFVLAVMTFYMINNNVGFMKTLASPGGGIGTCNYCNFLSTDHYSDFGNSTDPCTYVFSIHRSTCCNSIDFSDHVYFLSSFYTEDGNRCTFDTTGICT